MAEVNGALQQTQNSFFLSHNSSSLLPRSLYVITMQRGPRYKAYAELRELKLKMKNKKQGLSNPESTMNPPKKSVSFRGKVPVTVPDFCAALRRENMRPAMSTLPPSLREMTLAPPLSKASRVGVLSKLAGSKSANAMGGGRRGGGGGGGGVMLRKSYSSVEELKGLSSAAVSAINGEGRGGRSRTSSRTINKSVLSTRQYGF